MIEGIKMALNLGQQMSGTRIYCDETKEIKLSLCSSAEEGQCAMKAPFLLIHYYTEGLKLMYTLFETLFLSNKMRQKYNLCCVLFLKLP